MTEIKEPYQIYVDEVKCKFCNTDSEYDFCSTECMRAYWSEMD